MRAGNLFDCNFNEKLKAYVHGIRLLSSGRSRSPFTNVNVLAVPSTSGFRSLMTGPAASASGALAWKKPLTLVARVVNLDSPPLKTEMVAKGDICLADPTLMRGINKSKDFFFSFPGDIQTRAKGRNLSSKVEQYWMQGRHARLFSLRAVCLYCCRSRENATGKMAMSVVCKEQMFSKEQQCIRTQGVLSLCVCEEHQTCLQGVNIPRRQSARW